MLEYFRMVTSGILPEGYSKDKKNRQEQGQHNFKYKKVIYKH